MFALPLHRRSAASTASLVVALIAACTAPNPDYSADGSATTDLASTCAAGPRTCQSSASAACVNGSYVIERNCPTGSECVGGYCHAPPVAAFPIGIACSSETQCYFSPMTYNDACAPFVVGPGRIEFHCAGKLGDGGSGSPCTVANPQCRSGFCIGSLHTCFRSCFANVDADCPVKGGIQLVCRPVSIRVEGVDVTADSCVFP